jgi:nucleoside 2-deoxyribosyltransferase
MANTQQPTRIYLAGPMFSDGDKFEQTALATALETAGFVCHVPQNNGIEVGAVLELLNDPALHGDTMLEPLVLQRCVAWVTRAVVALDIFQVIEACDCTVLNIDGRVPDEGAVVEATLACSVGNPVVLYKTTSISELGGNNNPMIGVIGTWRTVSSGPSEAVAAVKKALKSVKAAAAPALPSHVQELVDLGRAVSDIRERPPLTRKQLGAAAAMLAAVPPDLMALLEPITSLQAMCRQVVLAIIEFSKLGSGQLAKQRKVFLDQIAALQAWIGQPGVRDAIVQNPLTC